MDVEPWPDAGEAGDRDLATALRPDPRAPLTFRLPSPRALDALTLVAGLEGPRLPRSLDVEISADGSEFETVARRRRREERDDLRWVNGHPQAVLDHDLLAVPLGGRTVAAVRIAPYESGDPWTLGELLLHPARTSRGTDPLERVARPTPLVGGARPGARARPEAGPRGLVLARAVDRSPAPVALDRQSSQRYCQATESVSKLPPIRVVKPEAQATFTEWCRPTGTDRVMPSREFSWRSSFSIPSTVDRPPA